MAIGYKIENSAHEKTANRIVTQQLSAEPAPVALDVTLPERGTVLTFGRSVQVGGQHPMAITLVLKRSTSGCRVAGGSSLLAVRRYGRRIVSMKSNP